MYNETATVTKLALGMGGAGAGAAMLPATSGSNVGLILAYGAIAIGVSALIGQIVVRVIRRHYQLRAK